MRPPNGERAGSSPLPPTRPSVGSVGALALTSRRSRARTRHAPVTGDRDPVAGNSSPRREDANVEVEPAPARPPQSQAQASRGAQRHPQCGPTLWIDRLEEALTDSPRGREGELVTPWRLRLASGMTRKSSGPESKLRLSPLVARATRSRAISAAPRSGGQWGTATALGHPGRWPGAPRALSGRSPRTGARSAPPRAAAPPPAAAFASAALPWPRRARAPAR